MTTTPTRSTEAGNPCLTRNDDWICTRDRGHDGEHIARSFGGDPVATWAQADGVRSTDPLSRPDGVRQAHPTPEGVSTLLRPLADPDGHEEDEEYAVRAALGLRPRYHSTSLTGEHRHPDRRPCPPWCATGREGCEHEIEARRPLTAIHDSDTIATVASCYSGYKLGPDTIVSATWSSHLTRLGNSPTRIEVDLHNSNPSTEPAADGPRPRRRPRARDGAHAPARPGRDRRAGRPAGHGRIADEPPAITN